MSAKDQLSAPAKFLTAAFQSLPKKASAARFAYRQWLRRHSLTPKPLPNMQPRQRKGRASEVPDCAGCRSGLSRYELQAALIQRPELAQNYLDEVEHALHCSNRFCRGTV
jgi:hypothetical protein